MNSDDRSKQFWDSIKENGDKKLSDDERKHVEELFVVPTTKRGALTWNKADDDLCGEVPAPASAEESRQRFEYVNQECAAIMSQNRRADTYILRCLNDNMLLGFDALPDADKKLILDSRYGAVDDMAYRKHRTQLHQVKRQAESVVRQHRSNLETYMKIPANCELASDEQDELSNLYSWLLYQLNFDSIKWLQIPRSYNRPKMLTELMIRLFIEAHFACTFLQAEQIQGWFARDVNGWRLLLEKQVIFIAIRKLMPVSFWDLLFEELQRLVTSRKSVVFVHHEDVCFPGEMVDEYRTLAMLQNHTYCENLRIDRTSYQFQYKSPARTEGT